MESPLPIIAIVGRPNVGKSTLFNRLLGEERAVVEDIPGVTRDRNYARCERYSVPFYIVDTGGFELDTTDALDKLVVEQSKIAIEEADVVLVMFDGKVGVQPGDYDVVQLLREKNKPTVFAVNKCDSAELITRVAEFYELGVPELFDVSALSGHGVKKLVSETLTRLPDYKSLIEQARLDEIRKQQSEDQAKSEAQGAIDAEEDLESLADSLIEEPVEIVRDYTNHEFPPVFVPEESQMSVDEYERTFKMVVQKDEEDLTEEPQVTIEEPADYDELELPDTTIAEREDRSSRLDLIKIAIIGRPNVGKSTLVNALVGENRAVTSDISGTTRDSLDIPLTCDEQEFLLIDTAGLRKKGRITDTVEKYSTLRAMRSITAADVAIVVIDGTEEPGDQDAKVLGLAHETGCGILVAVNKWDKVGGSSVQKKKYTERLRHVFKFAPYIEVTFMSALTGVKKEAILSHTRRIAESRNRRVKTKELNRVLAKELVRVSAPSYRGVPVKMYYAAQVAVSPPTFLLFFNYPDNVHFSYERFIKNTIRSAFRFIGTDVKIVNKKK